MQFSATVLSSLILASSSLAATQPTSNSPSPVITELASVGQFATDLEIGETQVDVQKRALTVGANVSLDVVNAIKSLAAAVSSARDREAKVKAALYHAQYAGQGKYSVMVFNLRQDHYWQQAPDPARTAFNTVEIDGRTYGVWAFRGEATFVNQGDGGWKNWGFYGWTDSIGWGQDVFFHDL